jgi:anti-anti-sigma regulatory factor
MSSDDPHGLEEQERLRETLARTEHALDLERKLRGDAEAMLEGLRGLSSIGSVEEAGAALLSALRRLFHCRDAVMLVDEGEGALVAHDATSPSLAGSRWTIGPLLRRVLAGQPVALFEVRDVPEWAEQPEAVRAAVRSALHVPLITSRRAAVLVATHEVSAFFSPRHVEIARRFTQMAVPVVDSLEAKAAERERLAAEERARLLEDQRATLEEQLDTIRRQQEEIERLAAPVIPIWPSVLLVPFVGAPNAAQAAAATERILHAMARERAREVILDVTGIERADDDLCARIGAVSRAVRLMGGRCVLTGTSPDMARLLTNLDVDASHLETSLSLEEALRSALEALGLEVRRVARTSRR